MSTLQTDIFIQGDVGASTHEAYTPSGDSYSAKTALPWNGGWGSVGQDNDDIFHKAYQSNASQRYDVADDTWTPTGGYTGSNDSWATMDSDTSDASFGQIYSSDNAEGGDIGQTDMHAFDTVDETWAELTGHATAAKHAGAGFGVGGIHYSAAGSTIASRTTTVNEFQLTNDSWAVGTAIGTARGKCRGGSYMNLYGFIMKGETGAGDADDIAIYDVAADSWAGSTADSGHGADYGGCAFQISSVYTFGGNDGAARDEAREYEPQGDIWSALTAMSATRTQPTVLPHGDRAVAAGTSIAVDTEPPTGVVAIAIDNSGYPDGDTIDINVTLGTYQRRQSAIDKGMIAGGDTGAPLELADVERYDNTGGTWSSRTNLSATRAYQTCFPDSPEANAFVQVGGKVAGAISNSVIITNISGDSSAASTAHSAANLIRAAGARCSENGFTFGGQVATARVTTIYKSTRSTDVWSTPGATLTIARDNASACSSDEDTDNAFIVGGNEVGSPVNKIEEFDASAPSITARTAATATAEEHGSFSVGGSDQIGYFKDSFMELYSIAGDAWTVVTNPSMAAGTRGLQVDYEALVVGGESLTTTKKYNWAGDTFSVEGVFTTARGHFGWNNNSPYS